MYKRKQVGGIQEVFIEPKSMSVRSAEKIINLIEKIGGHVRHVFQPAGLLAMVPSGKVAGLKGKAGIQTVHTGEISMKSRSARAHAKHLAYTAWNAHIGGSRRVRALESRDLGKSWGAAGKKPLHPPKKIEQHFRRLEATMMPKVRTARAARGAPNFSIPVLLGRVGVGVVFVDSTVAKYKITNQEKSKIVSELTEGLNMLAGFEPRAKIQWFYDFKRPAISLAANKFTSANKNSWENLWRDEAMKKMGYTANLAGMNKYIADVKKKTKSQWAYALFVTKYDKTWFAYYWGNHVVMDFAVDGWGINNFSRVVAHETGHVFGCPDEYSNAGCNCTSLHGRYQIKNGNCKTCASPFVPCLMEANTEAVCDYTRGHLGWNELAVQSKGTTTLKGTWTFDFDSGIQGPSGGADIWWEQVNNTIRLLVPQSGAMLKHMGKPNFDAVSYQTLTTQAYTTTPINGSNNSANKLKPGSVIAIKTSAGRYAKVKINSYGYNLGITWVTYK